MQATFMRQAPSPSDADSSDSAAYLGEGKITNKYETVPPITQYTGGALSAANIRRIPTIHLVPLDDLYTPPYAIEPDEIFVRLYCDYILGRANVYFTRMSEKDIPSRHRPNHPVPPKRSACGTNRNNHQHCFDKARSQNA